MENFKSLGIRKDLIKGINEMGIITPSEIQAQAIPILLKQEVDLVAKAQTGTGKTAAYALPLIEKINPNSKTIQGLILCPTRELGQQIAKQIFKFTKYTDKIFTECVYGGGKIEDQIKNLKRTTHILVATPGRLNDLIKRKILDLSNVRTIILDEADEMLSMGFKSELDIALNYVSPLARRWLFSATMPHGILQIVNNHLSAEAIKIDIKGKSGVNKHVEHQFLLCDDREKLSVLLQFLSATGKERGIIFCKTKKTAQTLVKQLIAKNIKTDTIHGDLLQKEREKALRNFTKNHLKVLVATDIAARGIDIDNLAFVVHYELPSSDEYYTHRSGRTGRGGKSGISISLINSKELKQIRAIEKKVHVSFKQIRRVK